MKTDQDYEIDIKNNKIKQGFLIKRSRILKEWRERWMVLTRTHLYSFVQKQVYKKPTEKIPLKQVSTIKSYYKNQYNRPQVIRIESEDAEFYLSAKNHQEKWAWMTAIEKMTDLMICPQEEAAQSQNLIRETIRMSTAIRKTINLKSEKKDNKMSNNSEISKDLINKLKLMIDSATVSTNIVPSYSFDKSKGISVKTIQLSGQQTTMSAIKEPNQKAPQVVEKIVYVPQIKQKIMYVPEIKQVVKTVYVPQVKQKIVYVPEIKQVIKTVYVQKASNGQNLSNQTGQGEVMHLFKHVMEMKYENPKPLIEFVVFLLFAQPERYTELVLKFATDSTVQHAFSNAFLQVINQQIDEQKLNWYLQFIMVLYQNSNEYFYMNDLKLLIEILIREIQMNRSYLNQFLIIGVINVMADKKWWKQVKHRRDELIIVINDVKSWTTDPQTKLVAEQLISKL